MLDTVGWADVLAWLSDEENVARLLADWEQESRSTEQSMTSRLEAAAAQIATLRDKMAALAKSLAETSKGESRRTLQDKLDHYADQVAEEEQKREQLLRESREAFDQAQWARDVRAWVRVVVERAATFTDEERRTTLKALGARVIV